MKVKVRSHRYLYTGVEVIKERKLKCYNACSMFNYYILYKKYSSDDVCVKTIIEWHTERRKLRQ